MDDADRASMEAEILEVLQKRGPYEMPKGDRGFCEMCDRYSTRLIKGECGACRDALRRP